jgi:hypothetical protein
MEIPAIVTIFHANAQFNNKRGTLVSLGGDGYYEINMDLGQRRHTVLFPVAETVLIFNEPLPQISADFEVER